MSRKERIKQVLDKELAPTFLQVEDESANHHVSIGAQTHFKVIAVSTKFSDLNRLARHRIVHKLLENEFAEGLHALSLHLYTADEWTKKEAILSSPPCRDGYKHNIK